jgi:hypothetical protein
MHITHFHNRFPENEFESAFSYMNSLDWNLSFHQSAEKWVLIAGDKLLASFDTREELDAFIFGLALGFAVLPDEVIDHLLKIIRD